MYWFSGKGDDAHDLLSIGGVELLSDFIKGANGYCARLALPVGDLSYAKIEKLLPGWVFSWMDLERMGILDPAERGYRPLNGDSYYAKDIPDGHLYVFPEDRIDTATHMVWAWSLAKDSQGALHLGAIRQLTGIEAAQNFLQNLLSWPLHRHASRTIEASLPEPMPENLAPTKPPRSGKKGRAWFLRPPPWLVNLP